jgi:glycine hydroxymethyltransferase
VDRAKFCELWWLQNLHEERVTDATRQQPVLQCEQYRQVKDNSKCLAESLISKGFHLVSGGSDNHLMLLDLRPSHPDLTGKQGQLALEKENVTLNRNTVPGETRSPFQTSGLRIGTPAVTSRGMQEDSMTEIASIIATVLEDIENESSIEEAKQKALALCANFPLPY